MRVAVLGLGEAGAALAADLVVAVGEVAGYDPAGVPTPRGVVRHDDPVVAVSGAGLVLAVTPASGASAALASALDGLGPGTIYADLSTSSPGKKQQLAAIAGDRFVDVALMAPVPGNGLSTPVLAAGPAVEDFAAMMRPLGMPVDVVGPDAGQAATRKLLRSVVMKGLAQLLIEALTAARAAGVADEVEGNLVAQLSAVDEGLVRRLVEGTPQHAGRRLEEMQATIGLLRELGVDSTMSEATAARLREIRRRGGPGAPTGAGHR